MNDEIMSAAWSAPPWVGYAFIGWVLLVCFLVSDFFWFRGAWKVIKKGFPSTWASWNH